MKKSLLAMTAGAVLGLAAAGNVAAAPFYIDNNVNFGGNGSVTSALSELGYTGTLATSIYFGNPGVTGTQVIDTNIGSVMNTYGFSAGSKKTLNGTTVQASYPFDPDQKNINALNTSDFPVDRNGFSDGEDPNAFGAGRWGLTYEYRLNGVTVGSGGVTSEISFTSGYFDLFYRDGGATANDGKQLLRLVVTGSDFEGVNLKIDGNISFDFDSNGSDDTSGDSFVQNFFSDGTNSFYNNWLSSATKVSWVIDTNVNPPVPTLNSLWDGADHQNLTPGAQGPLFRQSTLDGSIAFNTVPEPSSLALLGLALAGLSFVRRSPKNV